jgi:oxygen-independent coproporphyrinogen III oxidase
MVANPFQALYIHVPFCKNICDYCALYSVVNNEIDVRKGYLEKINQQLSINSKKLQNLTSIFIGGGTPTQLREEELLELLQSIGQFTNLQNDGEFTVECNPSTVTPEKFAILFNSGVNRLSFGAQSTTRSTRNTLGRRSSTKELENALREGREAGFSNMNIDLIYGVPGQELDDWQNDLETALSYKLPHYSAYSLILEEGTPMAERHTEVDDALAVDMYNLASEILNRGDISRYEISNYSKPEMHCRHNYDIWLGASYLGLGPAACSFDGENRWSEIRDLKKWLKNEPAEQDTISPIQRAGEILGFGFRTTNGWHKDQLTLCGVDCLSTFSKEFATLIETELIYWDGNRLKPTENGLLFADTVAEAFILID